jgi:error-prone DNA polymerase
VESDGSLRLGLGLVQGLPSSQASRLLQERARKAFTSLDDLKSRTSLGPEALRALASIGALNAWATDRRSALWHAERPLRHDELSGANEAVGALGDPEGAGSPLTRMSAEDRLAADYAALRLTTGPHPMALRRTTLKDVWQSAQLQQAPDGARIRVAGQVICRQRPGTAEGVCFLSLEDETGITNAIVSPELFEAERLRISTEPFLLVEGIVQRRHGPVHVRAQHLERLPDQNLQTAASHDFG